MNKTSINQAYNRKKNFAGIVETMENFDKFEVIRKGMNSSGGYVTLTHMGETLHVRVNNSGDYKVYLENPKTLRERKLGGFKANEVSYVKIKNLIVRDYNKRK